MVLEERIALMVQLGRYLSGNEAAWMAARAEAERQNSWFTQEYIAKAVGNICTFFLDAERLQEWLSGFPAFRNERKAPVVGLVMAGNIPLVGFHDFLSIFLSGCRLNIKLSSKDKALWEHILERLYTWQPECRELFTVSEQLKGCDAYIATGSNNSARYFSYYFGKYPHIIRNNRTSAAILSGQETADELLALSDDISLYFGRGCRNVTKIFVPEHYDFTGLLAALQRYTHHMNYHKYRNNYDFQLALYLLNKIDYMSSGSMLLVPSESLFAPISVLHYGYYRDADNLMEQLEGQDALQCLAGNRQYFGASHRLIPLGETQRPRLTDYADNVNTLSFAHSLKIS